MVDVGKNELNVFVLPVHAFAPLNVGKPVIAVETAFST